MFYVDTSALLAVLDADDPNHELARKTWKELLESGRVPACNSYVLVETYTLIQDRLGMAAVRTFHEDIFPILHV
ncbi:MAG: VapC toxin family PIN domain ribonuclease, partial [Firmicutes bacterium]|nr:VapC toxin family PIN domain ribonuclease [Bacillota bacterium]